MKRRHLAALLSQSVLLLFAATMASNANATGWGQHKKPQGTWYLELDASPYGFDGLNLTGMMTLHADRTVLIKDGGDFGGMPFNMQDSAQLGSWRYSRHHINIVTLFLQANSIGDPQSWFRVELELQVTDRDTLEGHVNVYQLACDIPSPFAVFSCPDPIEHADMFVPAAGPPNVPVKFRRLPARLSD